MPGPVQHQTRLLVGRFHRHEAHARPLHRLADRLGIGRVILLAFNTRQGGSFWKKASPDFSRDRGSAVVIGRSASGIGA
jgi:hypothetical protein